MSTLRFPWRSALLLHSEERKFIIVIAKNSNIADFLRDLLIISSTKTEWMFDKVWESTKSHHSSQNSNTLTLEASPVNQSRIHHNFCSICKTDSRSIWYICPWTMLLVFIDSLPSCLLFVLSVWSFWIINSWDF